jgi:methyltransferase (TIGR00027 family)
MLVAIGRGLGTSSSAAERPAARLVPTPVGWTLDAIHRLGPWSAPARLAARVVSAGMVDHVCLRTAAIDAAVDDAIDRGVRQLVILCAGLDARAWRMPQLRDTTVFELDHPATQADKRSKIGATQPQAKQVVYASIDFEHEAVAARLADSGHDADAPTMWIWEGVTPYLEPDAIDVTLADVAARSAPGSTIAMTYAVDQLPGPRALHAPIRSAFAVLGEPLRGLMSTARAAARLRDTGFALDDDTGSADWATRFGGHARLARPFSAERLAVATRPDGAAGGLATGS